MDYGKLRIGRLLTALVVAVGLVVVVPPLDALPVSCTMIGVAVLCLHSLGVAFRLYDIRVSGLARRNSGWLMSRQTWILDFALRGYFEFEGDEPMVG